MNTSIANNAPKWRQKFDGEKCECGFEVPGPYDDDRAYDEWKDRQAEDREGER